MEENLENSLSLKFDQEVEVIKPRLSIFRNSLAHVSIKPKTDLNLSEEEFFKNYQERLKAEKQDWKQLYSKEREKNKTLREQLRLRNNKTEIIDYSQFSDEDLSFLNNRPNFQKYCESVAKLKASVDEFSQKLQNAQQMQQNELEFFEEQIEALQRETIEEMN